MGKQSITPTPRTTHAVLRIALVLVLAFISFVSRSVQCQTPALSVPLLLPLAIVFDASGNLYFAETANHIIRKVDTAGNISTIAGTGTQGFSGDNGPASSATLDSPQGLALDSANNLYIADTHNHRIRKLNLITATITTIAGTTAGFSGDNGAATAAQLNLPTALAVDSANNIYFADTGNHRIRRIDATSGTITTIAGTGIQGFSGDNGAAINANIDSPTGLAIDSAGNLYLADTHNHRIRCIDASTGLITTIAGTGIPGFGGDNAAATSANLALPHGLTIDSTGNLYLTDTANHRIRRIDASTGTITTVAGNGTQAYSGDNGPAIAASLDTPRAAAISPSSLVTLTDSANQRIRQLTAAPAPATTIQTIAGLGVTTPGVLTLAAPSVIAYGTGQLTATLASANQATGSITFFDTTLTSTTTLGTVAISSNVATLSTATLYAGFHNLTATFIGDQSHSAAQSATFALTISPQQLTAIVTPAILLYGQPVPAIIGTLTGILPRDTSNLSATFITSATTLSSVGTYPITATLIGPAAGNYSIANPAATLTINPAPALITLSNPTATTTTGSPLTLTAQVASTTSGTPTGSITLIDSGNPLSTSPLSSTGTTLFTIPSITQGAHSFTAFYSGSANFTSGTSTPQLIMVSAPTTNPDFTLASTGAITQTIVSGSSASYTFSVQMQPTMSSPVSLAAAGLPNLSTASFNPPTLPPGATTNTFTLTIATPGATAQRTPANNHPLIAWAFLLLPAIALTLRPRSNRVLARLVVLAALTFVLATVTGCGDRISTTGTLLLPSKNYTITVTGTATTPTGSVLQHSTNVTLVIEQPSN
jgi:sugar lactone lactonase YvrE